ncbi:MAG: hypothetical protein RTU30_06690 [Candidatus Thorarchaeota archaeon]
MIAIPLDEISNVIDTSVQLSPRRFHSILSPLLIPGQISLIHGPERSPLTAIAHAVVAGAAKSGIPSFFLDSGNNFSPSLARTVLGRVTSPESLLNKIVVGNVLSLDDLSRTMISLSFHGEGSIVVLDSLTGVLNLSGGPGSKGRQRELFRTLESCRATINQLGAHLLLTDHSRRDWSGGQSRPIGGNVIGHAVDSVVRADKMSFPKNGVRLLVERTPIVPSPEGVVVRISERGIRTVE